MNLFKRIFFIVIIAGPALPLLIATSTLINYLQLDPSTLHSFPHLHYAKQLYTLGFAWLAIALAILTIKK